MNADGDDTPLAPPQQEEQQGDQAIAPLAPPPPAAAEAAASLSSASSSALAHAVLRHDQNDVTMKSEGSGNKNGLIADGRKMVR